MEITIKGWKPSGGQINALREHLMDFFMSDLQIELPAEGTVNFKSN